MLVSKVWYVTLRHGKQAELDFKKRCAEMGAKRKSSGCPTWHATWIDLLHKRCHTCHEPASLHIGRNLLHGFTFLMSCFSCLRQAGPLQAIYYHENLPIFKELPPYLQIEHVPMFCTRGYGQRPPPPHWFTWQCPDRYTLHSCPYVLKAAISQKLLLRAQEDDQIQKLIDKHFSDSDSRQLVIEACTYSRKVEQPSCSLLNGLVKALLEDDGIGDEHFLQITEVYRRIREIPSLLKKVMLDNDIVAEHAWPRLESTYPGSDSVPKPWLEAIAAGEVAIDAFFSALLNHKEEQVKAEEESRLKKIKEAQQLKTLQEKLRQSGDWAIRPLCVGTACLERAEKYCSQICCKNCCTGPCILHGKTVSLAYLQTGKSVQPTDLQTIDEQRAKLKSEGD